MSSSTLTNYGQVPVRNSAPAKRPTGWIIATVTAASLALVGMIAAVLMTFAPASSPAPGPAAPANHAAAVIPSHKVIPSNVTPAHPVKPHFTPSASIELLQRELGQLNYYEGPITGYENQGTVQAITYLQRDAHLPQTGQMNAATQQALTNMLASGSNIMGAGN
jgi:hypothetical protein